MGNALRRDGDGGGNVPINVQSVSGVMDTAGEQRQVGNDALGLIVFSDKRRGEGRDPKAPARYPFTRRPWAAGRASAPQPPRRRRGTAWPRPIARPEAAETSPARSCDRNAGTSPVPDRRPG